MCIQTLVAPKGYNITYLQTTLISGYLQLTRTKILFVLSYINFNQ